jgi:hypothetical protein
MGDPFSVCCWNVYASILEAGAQCISSARHASGVMRGLPSNRHSYRELLIEDPIIEGVLNYSITRHNQLQSQAGPRMACQSP